MRFEQTLGFAQGLRAFLSELFGAVEGVLINLFVGHDVRRHADLHGFFGGEKFAEHEFFGGFEVTGVLHQGQAGAAFGTQREVDKRQLQARTVTDHDKIGVEQHGHADTDRDAIDGHDQRFGEITQGV